MLLDAGDGRCCARLLWLTQRDTVQAWLAYLTTATGVALGVFELFGLVSRPGIPKE